MRTCPKCGKTKDDSHFYTKRKSNECKECGRAHGRAYGKAYYETHKEERINQATAWYRQHREEIRTRKNSEAFKTTGRVEYKKLCRVCGRPFVSSFPAQLYCSPECKGYAETKTAAAKDREAAKDRYVILARDGFRCAYCGRTSYEDGLALHIDHIVPKNADGTSTAGNLITACARCNNAKGPGRLPLETETRLLKETERRNASNNIGPETKIRV